MNIGLLPDELMYLVLDTNSPIFLPVQIGKTNQLRIIIIPEASQPIVRSESAPVEIILSKPIATPKFHAKLINQPIYLGILPANSYPSGSPVGLILSGPSSTLVAFAALAALAAFEGFAGFAALGAAFATAFAAFGFAFATAFATFGLAFAGFVSSKLSTLSSKPIFYTSTVHCTYGAVYIEILTLCKLGNCTIWHTTKKSIHYRKEF